MTTYPLEFRQYVYGTEGERLAYERAWGCDLHEHRRVFDPWPPEDQRFQRSTALALLRGDEFHTSGACRRDRQREHCATCILLGYQAGDEGPNYSGWARVYVEAGLAIPERWRDAFEREGADGTPYADALGRDLVTYGHPRFS